MTKNELEGYRNLIANIELKEREIADLKSCETVGLGTVKGSRKTFPYIPCRFKVGGIDPVKVKQKQEQIDALIREEEIYVKELLKKREEIEKFIREIKDTELQTIFRCIYIHGMTQEQAAVKANINQSNVSRKIEKYLKLHNMHKKR